MKFDGGGSSKLPVTLHQARRALGPFKIERPRDWMTGKRVLLRSETNHAFGKDEVVRMSWRVEAEESATLSH